MWYIFQGKGVDKASGVFFLLPKRFLHEISGRVVGRTTPKFGYGSFNFFNPSGGVLGSAIHIKFMSE